MGPAVLITLGVLFMMSEFWHYGFQWPVLLIVIGLIKIWQSTTSTEGHNSGMLPPSAPVQPVTPVDTSTTGQVHNG